MLISIIDVFLRKKKTNIFYDGLGHIRQLIEFKNIVSVEKTGVNKKL